MSKDEIHEIAQADTPEAVRVPETWQGLIVWAAARFGIGLIIAAVFAYGLAVVYADMRADRAELFKAYLDNSAVMQEVKAGLQENTRAIQSNTNAIDAAHRRAADGHR